MPRTTFPALFDRLYRQAIAQAAIPPALGIHLHSGEETEHSY